MMDQQASIGLRQKQIFLQYAAAKRTGAAPPSPACRTD
jgi:hypothetical protein